MASIVGAPAVAFVVGFVVTAVAQSTIYSIGDSGVYKTAAVGGLTAMLLAASVMMSFDGVRGGVLLGKIAALLALAGVILTVLMALDVIPVHRRPLSSSTAPKPPGTT
jgi:inner membrane protein involved in colicin E2 resistance